MHILRQVSTHTYTISLYLFIIHNVYFNIHKYCVFTAYTFVNIGTAIPPKTSSLKLQLSNLKPKWIKWTAPLRQQLNHPRAFSRQGQIYIHVTLALNLKNKSAGGIGDGMNFCSFVFYVVCVGLPCLGSNSKTFPVRVSQAFSFFLSLYFQLDIEKMIHVQNPLQLVKIFKITDSLAPPTHPTTPNQPTTKQQSYHLRQRMWSVKNPWCRAKQYVFICTKIVQVLERSNAMSLPKGLLGWNVKLSAMVRKVETNKGMGLGIRWLHVCIDSCSLEGFSYTGVWVDHWSW